MKDSQPAWALRSKEETANGQAVLTLLRRSAKPPQHVVEFFGGIGGVTKLVKGLYPKASFETWDGDSKCLRILRKIHGVKVVGGDSITDCQPTKRSGVLMDFNLWTLLKAQNVYSQCMCRVFESRPLWIQVTDSSFGKLHLNYKSYGLTSPSKKGYLKAVNVWAHSYGYSLKDWEKSHYKTTMLLFMPLKKPPKMGG